MPFSPVIVTVEAITWVTPVLARLGELAFEPLEDHSERLLAEGIQAALNRQTAKLPLDALPLRPGFFGLLALELGNFFGQFFLGIELEGKALFDGFGGHGCIFSYWVCDSLIVLKLVVDTSMSAAGRQPTCAACLAMQARPRHTVMAAA